MFKNEFILWVNSHQKQATNAVHHHKKCNPLSIILVLNCRVQSCNEDLTLSAWKGEEVRRCIFAHTHELCHHQCSGSAAPAPCLLALIDQCFDQPWLHDLSSLLVFIYLLSTVTPLVSSYTLDLRPNHPQLLSMCLRKKAWTLPLKKKKKKNSQPSKVLSPCQTSTAVLSKVHHDHKDYRIQGTWYSIHHVWQDKETFLCSDQTKVQGHCNRLGQIGKMPGALTCP